MSKTTKRKTFAEWIHTNGTEDIESLKEQKALYENERPNDYIVLLDLFLQRVKREQFGPTMVFSVESSRTFKNAKGHEMLIVDAIALEPAEDGGYRACPHPLQPEGIWFVSSIIPKEKFAAPLTKGALFEAEYEMQKHPDHIEKLIKFNLDTYIEVEELFLQNLNRLGNALLAQTAEALFGSDVEKVVSAKFFEYYATKEQEYKMSFDGLQEKIDQLEQAERLYVQRQSELSDKQQQWKKILDKIERYRELEEGNEEEPDREEHPWEPEKAVEMLQSLLYHNSADELVYDEAVIEMFLRALQTNTLVVLSGPSGTGKSSLVTEMAKAIKGAKAKMIPIQSGWTDTQDLLGYFNPIDKSFVASPFMEALANAAQEEEQGNLHLICLDEMNLAHVEHYFAEFLSVREQTRPYIQLYPKRFFLQAKELLASGDANISNEQLLIAKELVERYPYKFEIPQNVRFVGTINMDHTVKSLSPKVIDRSFVIEIDHMETKEKARLQRKVNEKQLSGCIAVSLEQFNSAYGTEHAFEKEALFLVDLSQRLERIANAPLNSRGKKQIVNYLARVPKQKLTKPLVDKYYDQLIHAKLLPRIEMSKRDEQGIQILQNFRDDIQQYPRSAKKLAKMLEHERMVRFW